MNRNDYENDYYTGKYAGFLLMTTLFVALLFSVESGLIGMDLPKYSLYLLALMVFLTIVICGKLILCIPDFSCKGKGR
jgi:Na+-driven multidrug efflux pump